MKVKLLGLFIILLISVHPVFAEVVFQSEPYVDEVSDSVDFFACFEGGMFVSLPMEIDLTTVKFGSAELLDEGNPLLTIDATTITPLLPHMTYTLEFIFDTDNDQSTGANTPNCFYNGLGADYDVGVEVVTSSITSTWVDIYENGAWVRVAEPEAYLEEFGVHIEFPLNILPIPLDASAMAYLISEGALDMAPNYEEPPIKTLFHYIPEALINYPLSIEEGTPFEFDGSESSSGNGPIVQYHWDFNGDGAYEETHPEPTLPMVYNDDGWNQVSLMVTDNYGFTGVETIEFKVENVPPSNPEITIRGEPISGELVTFTGVAEDIGQDELKYNWDFGDGETAEGMEVTHSFETAGSYQVTLIVLDDDGGESSNTRDVNVVVPTSEAPTEPKPESDLLLYILVALFGIAGWFIYDFFFRGKKSNGKKKDDDDKDFCEEHPEVVEEETKKCDEALEALDDALGPIEENLENYERTWQDVSREVGRLIGEWDIAYAVVASLTESETELYKDASEVQEIAGKVTGFAGTIKTIAKEGAEEAVKDFAKDMAKDRAKNAAGEMSQFVGDVLKLEEWAMSEIGIGFAKLVTGIDPKKEASDVRRASLKIVNELETWISRPHAYNAGKQPPKTLQDYIDDMQVLIDAINKALQGFETAVAGFRCVDCTIDGPYSEHIQNMINKLNSWMRAFGDMIDEVERRLEQAIAMFNLGNAYEDPYSRVGFQNRQIPDIRKALKNSSESRR